MDFAPVDALAERLAVLDVPWWVAGGWAVDLFLDAVWVYHRGGGTLRLPTSEMGYPSRRGVNYLSPKIVLLFKSRQLRDKDTEDSLAMLPLLDAATSNWLRRQIRGWRADHPCLVHLDR